MWHHRSQSAAALRRDSLLEASCCKAGDAASFAMSWLACRLTFADVYSQELQRGLISIAALMPDRMNADDGSATAPGHARQRPAAARALRCIAAVHMELQVRLPIYRVLLCCCQHCRVMIMLP